jgi:hypothetical protein
MILAVEINQSVRIVGPVLSWREVKLGPERLVVGCGCRLLSESGNGQKKTKDATYISPC